MKLAAISSTHRVDDIGIVSLFSRRDGDIVPPCRGSAGRVAGGFLLPAS